MLQKKFKLKKKYIIIGGGITGCVVALYISKKGHNVTILEKSNNIGGILKDFERDKDIFFRGCQYLDINQEWYRALNNDIKKFIKTFNHSYSSLTNFKNSNYLSNDFAVPVFSSKKIINTKYKKKRTLEDRINTYSDDIKHNLQNYLKKFDLSLKKFPYNSAIYFHLSRISSTSLDNLLRLKKIKSYDNLLAIKKKYFIDINKFKAGLPIKGYNEFFNQFKKLLTSNRVTIKLNSNVKPILREKKIELKVGEDKIDSDYVVWTGNPTILIKEIFGKKLNTFPIKINQYSFNINKRIRIPEYYQIYSDKIDCLRIFIYQINSTTKVNMEFVYAKNNKDLKKKDLIKLLKKINIILKPEEISQIHKFFFVRYDPLTIESSKLIKELINFEDLSNLICSPFDYYDRDSKINILKTKLKL